MKIKDITFREDAKVTAVDPGKKTVTYTDTSTNISTTVPDTMAKPTPDGAVAVDTKAVADAGAGEAPKVTVGANVKDLSTSESQGDEVKKVFKLHGVPVGEVGIDPEASPGNGNWYVKHYASGHDTVGFDNAEEAMAELKYIVKHHMEEGHHDLISQGNHDVGGDATDNFIDQVVDKGYERANRGPGTGSVSTISEKKLKESDELYKWLTIAGIK